jgi:hypothetical protein
VRDGGETRARDLSVDAGKLDGRATDLPPRAHGALSRRRQGRAHDRNTGQVIII